MATRQSDAALAKPRKLTPREQTRMSECERELLEAPCRYHMKLAICDQCPERFDTDGFGFPHPSIAKGRARYRLCPKCRKLKSIDEWDIIEWSQCIACSGRSPAEVAAELARVNAKKQTLRRGNRDG